jgi:hypothetical protein
MTPRAMEPTPMSPSDQPSASVPTLEMHDFRPDPRTDDEDGPCYFEGCGLEAESVVHRPWRPQPSASVEPLREALEYVRDGLEDLAVKVGSGVDSWGIHGEINHQLARLRAALVVPAVTLDAEVETRFEEIAQRWEASAKQAKVDGSRSSIMGEDGIPSHVLSRLRALTWRDAAAEYARLATSPVESDQAET